MNAVADPATLAPPTREALSAKSPDAALRAALERQPHLLHAGQREAAAARARITAAAHVPTLPCLVWFWAHYTAIVAANAPNPRPTSPVESSAALDAMVRQFRAALDCRAVLVAVLAEIPLLHASELLSLRPCDTPANLAARAYPVMRGRPGLAALLERFEAEAERLSVARAGYQTRIDEAHRLQREDENAAAALELVRRLSRECKRVEAARAPGCAS
jgi:hypothetical protein